MVESLCIRETDYADFVIKQPNINVAEIHSSISWVGQHQNPARVTILRHSKGNMVGWDSF